MKKLNRSLCDNLYDVENKIQKEIIDLKNNKLG